VCYRKLYTRDGRRAARSNAAGDCSQSSRFNRWSSRFGPTAPPRPCASVCAGRQERSSSGLSRAEQCRRPQVPLAVEQVGSPAYSDEAQSRNRVFTHQVRSRRFKIPRAIVRLCPARPAAFCVAHAWIAAAATKRDRKPLPGCGACALIPGSYLSAAKQDGSIPATGLYPVAGFLIGQ